MARVRVNEMQERILRYCAEQGRMVDIVDMTVAFCAFRRAYSGRWFDEKLLSPRELEQYKRVKSAVSRAIVSLFKKGFVDVGNEDTFDEGIKQLHRRLYEAKQNPKYFLGEGSPEFIERDIAFSKELMETRDFAFAKEQLERKVETVGLTEEGNAWIEGQDDPGHPPNGRQ